MIVLRSLIPLNLAKINCGSKLKVTLSFAYTFPAYKYKCYNTAIFAVIQTNA